MTGREKNETQTATPKRVGRPSTYADEIADRICALLSEGHSLRKICERKDMPPRRTVFGWLRAHEDFRRQYALAREMQADWYFDECLEIADNASKDYVMSTNEDGAATKRVDHENINRARLRVDTRKWVCARLAPQKYSEKVTTELRGALNIGVSPLQQILQNIDGTSRGLPSFSHEREP